MSTLGAGVVPLVSTILSGVPERQGESLRDPGGQTSSVLAQMGRLSTPPPPKKRANLARGRKRSGYPGLLRPIRLSHRWDSLRDSRPGLGRRRLHPARVRQEGPSGKEGTTPTPAAATPGLSGRAGGAGRRLAPASLGRLPAPPRGGRQMGRPPAQRRRQETAAGAARDAAASAGGGDRPGAAP